VDRSGRLRSGGAGGNGPGADLLFAGCEETL